MRSVFKVVGRSTATDHRVALCATKNGKLTALIHERAKPTTEHNEFPEQFTFPARHLNAAKKYFRHPNKIVYLDMLANSGTKKDEIFDAQLNRSRADQSRKIRLDSAHTASAKSAFGRKFL